LFNLEDDPEELTNCINAHPEVASDLEKELRKICDPESESDRAEAFIEAQLADMT
jgi:choline-sulfatase